MDLSVPQREVSVRLHLLDGRDLEGVTYVHAIGPDGGPGKLIERLNNASEEFREIVEELPTLRIVIEHLAFVGRDATPPYGTFKKALDLARFPNVYMKVPGLGEICHPPCPYKDIPPLVDMAYEAFGAKRLMWGSDWPPVVMREGHRQSLWFTMQNIRYRNEEDKEWIFGRTALSLFNLGHHVAAGGGLEA